MLPTSAIAELKALLEEISEQLRTQDNRLTADPIFMVQERKRIYGIDTDYDPQIAWLYDDEAVEVDAEEASRLEAQYQEDSDDSPEGFRRVGYQEHWEHVQPFFTEAAADLYIKQNSHRHKGPLRTYAESAYRNHQWKALREFLMNLAPSLIEAVEEREQSRRALASLTEQLDAADKERDRLAAENAELEEAITEAGIFISAGDPSTAMKRLGRVVGPNALRRQGI